MCVSCEPGKAHLSVRCPTPFPLSLLQWWGATLVGPSTEKHPDHPDASVYELA